MKMKSLKLSEWQAEVVAWKESGQTARMFAQGRGYRHETLSHWSWQFGYDRRHGKGAAAKVAKLAKQRLRSKGDIEASWIDASAAASEVETSTWQITVNARVLTLPTSIGAQSLQRIVRAMESL